MQENRQEKSPIKQKILLYLNKKGVSLYEFYKKSGVTRGILTQNNGINEENITRFLDYASDVNLDWLLTGKGDMLKSNVSRDTPQMPVDDHKPMMSNGKDKQNFQITQEIGKGIPYFDVDFIGGFNEVFNNQTTIPACSIIVPGFEKATLWCNVTGRSMEPKINPGDIIALRECTVNDIQYGEIYAIVLDTLRTIKIIRRGTSQDSLRFVPININNFDEQEFNVNRIQRVFEVVGAISKFF